MILTDLIPIKLNSMENDEYKAIGWGSSETNAWYFAFDGIKVTNDNHIHSTPAINAWVGVQFKKEKKKLNLIRIYPRQNLPNDVWRTFTIQGSDNGVEWIDIKKFSNVSFQNNTPQDFELYENNSQYFYYRLFGNENSPRGYLGISEIEMFTKSPANKSLILHDNKYKKWKETIPYSPDIYKRDNQVPALTSNTSAGGLAFSQHLYNYANAKPYLLFDKNKIDTSDSFQVQAEYKEGTFFGYIFNTTTKEKKKIKSIAMKRGMGTPKPKNIFIEVSHDTTTGLDGTWNTVYTEVLTSWDDYTWKEFDLGRVVEAVAIRFRWVGTIILNHSWQSFIEMEIYSDYYLDQPEIPYTPSHWSTVSTTLPTSTQFLNDGVDSLSHLFERTVTELEPIPMTDKSEILGVGEVGKVFSNTIDLKKFFDIRSIRTEVKK